MSNFKEKADEYTIAAMTDFCEGLELDALKDMIYFYESEGNYEACYGIKRAIDCIEKAKQGYYD